MRKIMNEVPALARSRVCGLLDRQDLELVHISYGSALEDKDWLFCAVAREIDPKEPTCYKVFSYSLKTDTLTLCVDKLTYSRALICMGNYIA